MKKLVLFFIFLFSVSCLSPEFVYADTVIQTKAFSADAFQKFGIELKDGLSDTYYAGDDILIRGRVTDKKDTVFFFLKNTETEEKVSELFEVSPDGTFQFPISLPKTEGKYYIVIVSGNSFKTTEAKIIYLVAKKSEPSLSLPFSTSVRPNIIYGDVPYLDFGSDMWVNLTITQSGSKQKEAGKIIILNTIPLKYGNADLSLVGYPLSTPSSLNPIISRGLSWTGSIFIDRTRELIGKDLVSLRTIRNVGIMQFRLKKGSKVKGEYYITEPNGNVIEASFPKNLIDGNGYLRTNILIRESFLISNPGVYKIETVQSNGYAYFNLPISKNPFWGIVEMFSRSQITTLTDDKNKIDSYILSKINNIRSGLGKKSLVVDPKLTDIAQKKALDMATYDYVGHTTHGGLDIREFANSQKITIPGVMGENVAGGTNASYIFLQDGLEESGSHRSGMISETYKKIGIGYVLKNKKTYLVQIFGE